MSILEKKNIKWVVLGGLGIVGGWYFLKNRSAAPSGPAPQGTPLPSSTPAPGSVFPGKPPAPVKKGETVKALTYQTVFDPRSPNMKYYAAKILASNEIQFKSGVAGLFTRNVLQEGSKLWAEVQPSTNPMLAGVMGW